MSEVILKDGQTGDFESLKFNTVDPSDPEPEFLSSPDPTKKIKNPRFGKKRFLSWTLFRNTDEPLYWQAKGKDGTIYRLDQLADPKKGKITIITT